MSYTHMCRVHYRAYHREYRQRNLKKVRRSHRESRRRRYHASDQDRWRNMANAAIYRAKKRGEITPRPCESCGAVKAEAHHDDSYLLPHWMVVRWLCATCHGAWHRENKPRMPRKFPARR